MKQTEDSAEVRIVYRAIETPWVSIAGDGRLVKFGSGFHQGGAIPVPESVAGMLLDLTGAGLEEGRIHDFLEAVTASGSERAMLPFLMQRLAAAGGLQETICRGGQRIVTGTARALAVLSTTPSAVAARPFRLSGFAALRRSANGLLLEAADADHPVTVHDPGLIPVLFRAGTVDLEAYAGPGSHAGRLAGEVERVLRQNRILVEDSRQEPSTAWNFHDLLYHTRSGYRWPAFPETRHQSGCAGAGVAAGQPRTEIPLPRPLPRDDLGHVSILTAFENRRSTREFSANPITLPQLSEFLIRSGGATPRLDLPGGKGRPYPAAGACYELNIYLVVNACSGLDAGLYKYDAGRHRLQVLLPFTEACRHLVECSSMAACGAAVQVLIVLAAEFDRILRKYPGFGHSLILKDVGAVYQTFYLVAAAMGLGACAVGAGDREVFTRITGLDPMVESPVGELILGSLPAASPL